jgi:cytochrome c1
VDDCTVAVIGKEDDILTSVRWLIAATAILLAVGAVSGLVVQGDKTARAQRAAAADLAGGDPDRGKTAIVRSGCGACHRVPGIATATGQVGPDLSRIGGNIFVAGVMANQSENIVRWIMDPREVDPKTAMPDLDLDRQTAQDIAAYLYASSQ